jgi:hypothetical protein
LAIKASRTSLIAGTHFKNMISAQGANVVV